MPCMGHRHRVVEGLEQPCSDGPDKEHGRGGPGDEQACSSISWREGMHLGIGCRHSNIPFEKYEGQMVVGVGWPCPDIP